MVTLRDLKVGDFFKFKSSSSVVYVRGSYDRSSKKYEYYPFDDVNDVKLRNGSVTVFTDFVF